MTSARMAVAIPAYSRADLLAELLAVLPADRVTRVYVSIDGSALGAEAAVAETVRVAREFAATAPFEMFVHALPSNVGVAVNVLGALEWMLRHEERGVLLEDDCHPIPEFFDFIDESLNVYAVRDDVWLSCGTQMAPAELIDGTHALCPIPLMWGWGTTRAKWAIARVGLDETLRASRVRWMWRAMVASPVERYWHAGMRRAADGRVDTWDLPLVYAMRRAPAVCVLPRTSLVTNVGDDVRATHTANEQRWTRLKTQPVAMPLRSSSVQSEHAVTSWLGREVYGISVRHLVSTSARWLLDRRQHPKRPPLAPRLNADAWADAPGPTPTI